MKQEHSNIRLSGYKTAGLSEDEVQARKKEGLVNKLDSKITKTTGEIIKSNLFTLFNLFNFVIGLALILVGAYRNLFYLTIVLLNVMTGIIQELHAKKLVEELSLLSAENASVIRDRKIIEIPVEELVLGDVMELEAGRQISADAVVEEGEVEVNESLLTGEADPVMKRRGDALLSGSFVISGRCCAAINHVGGDSFAARLSLEAKKSKRTTSELMASMKKVTKFTSYFIIPIGAVLFVQAFWLRGQSLEQSIAATSTALLGMLPKGMVLLISISLISGIIRMAKKKVLVQELYCLENLAQADILCLDKTGTITEGKISVSDLYEMNGAMLPFSVETAIRAFIGASEDNNATFKALKERFGSESSLKATCKTPFSSERKWSSVTFEGVGTLILGAPEKLTAHDGSVLPKKVLEAQAEGMRILCLGYSKEGSEKGRLPQCRVAAAIVLKDTVRTNVRETLEFFRKEGVDVKIISGDNPVTVSQVARQAGLKRHDAFIDMSQVHTEKEMDRAAASCSIFGRVTPSQKRELVKAFKKKGHTVAMVGDGVNDVLALKEADCSAAMNSGSDAAKQVSQLVLVDSDFSVLPDIVMEGRRVVNNVTRVGSIFLVKTIYSVLLSLLCILVNIPFPFLPIQITLIDLAIEGYPSFFLQFESDGRRIQNHFFNSVIKRAVPFSLSVIFGIGAVYFLASPFKIQPDEVASVMYCLTAWITILAVLKACRPFNPLRLFLFLSTTIGFYTAVYLFHGILELRLLSAQGVTILLSLAAGSWVTSSVISQIVKSDYKEDRKNGFVS